MLIAFSINMIRRASTGTMTFRATAAGYARECKTFPLSKSLLSLWIGSSMRLLPEA